MLDIRLKQARGAFVVDVELVADGVGVTALFGCSGAGKTSVINMVAGLTRPDSGHIQLNGKIIFDSAKRVDLPPERRRFGYIFQDGRLFPHLSVKQNLVYGMKFVSPSQRYVEFDRVVSVLGIGHLLHRRPGKLSGGEKQRVAIGRALLTSPDLMLMDEPLASLDEQRKAEVLPFIARLPEDFSVPIIYVSHSVREVLALAQTLVIMDSGRIVARGNPQELLAPQRTICLEEGSESPGRTVMRDFRVSPTGTAIRW